MRLPPPPLPRWLDRMLPFHRYVVRVGGYAMHVMEVGDGMPVVLLHGNPTWGFLWRRVAAALAGDGVRLIMPDLVGLGLSDKPSDDHVHTLSFHGEQLRGLLDELRLGRLVFVGQDWGGPIGAYALSMNPDQVAGLVLLNTALSPPSRRARLSPFHRLARAPVMSDLVFRLGHFPQRGLSLAQGDRTSIQGDVARAYRWPLRRLRDNVAPLALARMVPDGPTHPSVAPLLEGAAFVRAFQGPAAIVWGRRDPVLGRALPRVAELLPHAGVDVTDAGHFLQEEVPEVIARAVREVVARARDAAPAPASAAGGLG